MAVTTTRADQYRQLARDFHLIARNLPPGEERSAMLKMAPALGRPAGTRQQPRRRPRPLIPYAQIGFLFTVAK
jgi:hypothetical protein